jgi:hypothetical protein
MKTAMEYADMAEGRLADSESYPCVDPLSAHYARHAQVYATLAQARATLDTIYYPEEEGAK